MAIRMACLGVTDADWKMLGLQALYNMEVDIARESFLRINDLHLVTLAFKVGGCQWQAPLTVWLGFCERLRDSECVLGMCVHLWSVCWFVCVCVCVCTCTTPCAVSTHSLPSSAATSTSTPPNTDSLLPPPLLLRPHHQPPTINHQPPTTQQQRNRWSRT
jgi:hypothetical protein